MLITPKIIDPLSNEYYVEIIKFHRRLGAGKREISEAFLNHIRQLVLSPSEIDKPIIEQHVDESLLICLDNALGSPLLSEEKIDSLIRWIKIYLSLGKKEYKEVLFSYIGTHLFNPKAFAFLPPFLMDDTERTDGLLPTFEKLKEHGLLNEVMKVIYYFQDEQKKRLDSAQELARRKQTKEANMTRKCDKKTALTINALEEYMIKVEDLWHPNTNDNKSKQLRNTRSNKENSLKRVFNECKDVIIGILKENGYQDNFERVFSNLFDKYTDVYVTVEGKTRNGYQLEKRAPRSEESKKRSSIAAKKRRKNTK